MCNMHSNHNHTGLDCELDIQRTTHMVRSFRPGLVQSEAQYQFIYTAINHYIQTICSRISAEKVSTNKIDEIITMVDPL